MLNQKEMLEMASKGEALSFYKKIGIMSGLKDDNAINTFACKPKKSLIT